MPYHVTWIINSRGSRVTNTHADASVSKSAHFFSKLSQLWLIKYCLLPRQHKPFWILKHYWYRNDYPHLPIIAIHITSWFFTWIQTKFAFIMNKFIIFHSVLCNQSLKSAHQYAFYGEMTCVAIMSRWPKLVRYQYYLKIYWQNHFRRSHLILVK